MHSLLVCPYSLIRAAFRFAGAANYCPVLAGTFAGARWGRDSIPESTLRHCAGILPDIEEAAAGLVETWK